MNIERVCVIGGGAAGLVALRHIKENPSLKGCLYEQTKHIGGIWNYTNSIGNDEYGLPIHSTAYKGLTTNLPKEIMGYLDYPFPPNKFSYISHQEVLSYLENYSITHKLESDIRYTTRVTSVEPSLELNKSIPRWKVKTQDLKTKKVTDHEFDAVIVCNGHYTKPFVPDNIENLSQFEGDVWHSRDYRTPNIFSNKRVIVLGGGPSAIDISLELMHHASQVVLCANNFKYAMPKKIRICSSIVSAKSRSFITKTGDQIECDILLLCSGFVYDFPFISPSCSMTVEKGKLVSPLYRQIFNVKYPSMAFIGIPFTVCPFPQFDCQVRYCLSVFTGKIKLPLESEMFRDLNREASIRKENGVPFNHSHKMADMQWEYNKYLATDGGFLHLIKPVIKKLYNRAGERRLQDPAYYKFDNAAIIDHDNFDYVERAHVNKSLQS